MNNPENSSSKLPVVAIVGPINAGKSTLFNRLIGERLAVTSDVPGTTRDRQYELLSWNKAKFYLVDTAGLAFKAKEDQELEKNVIKQIQTAKKEADVLIFVVDGKYGTESVDRKVLLEFRKAKKPVILAINKLDSQKIHQETAGKFARLGIQPIVPVSSITGRGTGDLMDEIVKFLPKRAGVPLKIPKENSIRIAIVGKPNVGKSSLFNKILNHERMVVSSVAGTTRTAIDSDMEIDGVKFTFIDTAGLWRKAKKQLEPDVYSTYQVFKSIRRSDVCFLVVDIAQPLTHQDLVVAQNILDQFKGYVILANKIDIIIPPPRGGRLGGGGAATTRPTPSLTLPARGREKISTNLCAAIAATFPFLKSSPIFLTSANTGEGIQEAITAAKKIYKVRHKTIHQDELNRLLARRIKINSPKRLRDEKIPKVFGLNQIDTNPPAFELLVNSPSAISEQFKKSLENAIVKDLDFTGTPIRLLAKKKI